MQRSVKRAEMKPGMGAAWAGHYYNRIWVITTGCLMWAVCTAAFSQCNSVAQGYVFWGAQPLSIPGTSCAWPAETGESASGMVCCYPQASELGKLLPGPCMRSKVLVNECGRLPSPLRAE